jgi:hypothetical protein
LLRMHINIKKYLIFLSLSSKQEYIDPGKIF